MCSCWNIGSRASCSGWRSAGDRPSRRISNRTRDEESRERRNNESVNNGSIKLKESRALLSLLFIRYSLYLLYADWTGALSSIFFFFSFWSFFLSIPTQPVAMASYWLPFFCCPIDKSCCKVVVLPNQTLVIMPTGPGPGIWAQHQVLF